MENKELHTVNIGKNGLTEGTVKEIMFALKIKKTIKVKFLKSFIAGKSHQEKKQLFHELAERTAGKIEKQVGFVLVLKK